MISKSISWSTCINFWSHSSISVVFFLESLSSSADAGGSARWWMHHSMTLFKTASLTYEDTVSISWHDGISGHTLGMGMGSFIAWSPISSIMFLIKIDRSATSRSADGHIISLIYRLCFARSRPNISWQKVRCLSRGLTQCEFDTVRAQEFDDSVTRHVCDCEYGCWVVCKRGMTGVAVDHREL